MQHNNEQNEATEQRPRSRYEKPAIIWEEELEVRKTLAVMCAKNAGRGGTCNAAPSS